MAKKNTNSNTLKNDVIATKIENNRNHIQSKKHPIINILLILSLISSISYFISILLFKQNDLNIISELISVLLVTIFNIFFVCSSINSSKKHISSLFFSILFLIIYNVFGISTSIGIINIPNINKVDNFTGKSLVDVVEWADKHNINLIQNYEYSDMVEEYHIIGQKEEVGTKVKDIKSLTVSVSEGPNPNKEVIVPNMVTWNCEKVLKFINENKLSNVEVNFISSDKVKDTVIEQSKSGNMTRNEELKLTFSLGDDDEISDIKLSDLTNKSRFEAEFYLKQHSINYEIEKDFSSKIKRDYVISQSIKPGTIVKNKEERKVIITISRGEKIKVPNLKKMSMTQITDWVIKNHLKLEFTEKYDESVSDNKVVSANYQKGDIIEQGSLISIVLSKGKLIIPSFKSLTDFKEWAEKYEIHYQEEHQFSDSVSIGEVISYSHKTGDVIKNNDTITVTISDGKQIEVPNLVGMSKSDIITKLNKLDLKYSFVYKNSNSVAVDKAISQSISSGSKVSNGTTITVTLSSGKKQTSSSNNSSSSSSGGGSSSNNTTTCESKTYTIDRGLNNIFKNYTGFTDVKNALIAYFNSNYPNVQISIVGVDGGDATSGSYIGGIGPGTSVTSCNGVTYTIKIAL